MSQFSLDELYGVTINDYLQAHLKTTDELIADIEIDIELLRRNKQSLADININLTERQLALYSAIDKMHRKKVSHLKRITNYVKMDLTDFISTSPEENNVIIPD